MLISVMHSKKSFVLENIIYKEKEQGTGGLHMLVSSVKASVILPVHTSGFWIFAVVSSYLFHSKASA